ncbi:hypothetical protein HDV06_005998 [Boothiomyces sp. JEL0866]|nr:hypothetical protein HDV06_005998 [Boothiomyces sp. JEL0866]
MAANQEQELFEPYPPGTIPPGTIINCVLKNTLQKVKSVNLGGFAHVYTVFSGDTRLVLKRISCPDKTALLQLINEAETHRKLSGHESIVQFLDYSYQPLFGQDGYELYILMEHCQGGHLVDYLNSRLENRPSETEILIIFTQICEAVAYMHSHNPPIIHRDLKIENVLLSSTQNYKLCDFGSCTTKIVPANINISINEIRKIEEEISKFTTLQYRAPEMCDLYQKKGLSEKVDIWALGVLLYKVMYYTTPFEETGKMAILNGRYIIPTLPIYSDDLKSLVKMMLEVDPERRPDIYQKPKPLNLTADVKEVKDTSIFREISKPTDDSPLQNVKVEPMRRGRPVKSPSIDKMPSNTNITSNFDDLFDGTAFNTSAENLGSLSLNPNLLDFQSISNSNSMNFTKPMSKQPSTNFTSNAGSQNIVSSNSAMNVNLYEHFRAGNIAHRTSKTELAIPELEPLINLDNFTGIQNSMKPPLANQQPFQQNPNNFHTMEGNFASNPKRISGFQFNSSSLSLSNPMIPNSIGSQPVVYQGSGSQSFNPLGNQFIPNQQFTNPNLSMMPQQMVSVSNNVPAQNSIQHPGITSQNSNQRLSGVNFAPNNYSVGNQSGGDYFNSARQSQSQTSMSGNHSQNGGAKYKVDTLSRQPSQSQPYVQNQMLMSDTNITGKSQVPTHSRPTSNISIGNPSPNSGNFPISQSNFALPLSNNHRISQSFQSNQQPINNARKTDSEEDLFGSKQFVPESRNSQTEFSKSQSRISISNEIPKRESKVSALAKQFENLSSDNSNATKKERNDPWVIDNSVKKEEHGGNSSTLQKNSSKNNDASQDKPPPKPPRNRLSMAADSPHNPFK